MGNNRKNIALFVALLENEFSMGVLEGAARGAKEIDANLIVFPVGLVDGEYRSKEHNIFRYQYNVMNAFLKSNSIDAAIIEYGSIMSSVDQVKKQEFLSMIGDMPVVLLSEEAPGYTSICIDNTYGLEEVVRHLIQVHECKKIGFVSGPKNNQDAQERLRAYQKVMTEYGLDCGADWITYGNFSVYSEAAVKELLENHPDVEAIVFANDHMAMGGMDTLKAMNIIPGKDILVTGFDNIPSSLLTEPPLTTVVADSSQLSYRAMLALNGDITLKKNTCLPTQMIARNSCGCSFHAYPREKNISHLSHNASILHATRDKVKEAERRKQFEVEVGNINREMLSPKYSEREWIESVLEVSKKLDLGDTFIFLYEDCIRHERQSPWIQPKTVNLCGYCKDRKSYIFDKNQNLYQLSDLFHQDCLQREERFDLMVTPLFYRENQYGLMLVESESNTFQYAFHMSNQISTTLEILNVLNAQERIRQQLEEANYAKSQFLANMSHEIRTPINAILGMNEMILRENQVPEIDDYALHIKNAANTLLSLVNDILDFSKIEAKKMSLIQVEYELSTLLKDAMGLMSMRAKEKGLELELVWDEKLPSGYIGDDVRIKQILLNLLSNAIKYTERGKVTLSVSGGVHGDYADLTFRVSDTGMGIKKENIAHLFEKFERIDEKKNRHIEGTGLGINITTGLLELMGSTLEVSSVYGEGSEFSFTLHQRITDKTPVNSLGSLGNREKKKGYIQKYTAQDAKILVVDDIAINRMIIKKLLGKSGITIEEAADGKQCLAMVQDHAYDLVLLDHMMPDMDGIETLQELRKLQEGAYSSLPVIALTANAISGSQQMYLDAGFNGYLAKPVEPELLDELIIKYLPKDKIVDLC